MRHIFNHTQVITSLICSALFITSFQSYAVSDLEKAKRALPFLLDSGGLLDPSPDGDDDFDGLTNSEEKRLGTRYDQADSDNDGLKDGFEVTYGFDPLNDEGVAFADPDDDGLANNVEQIYGTNPFSADTDGDGLRDEFEIAYGFNPTDGTLFEAESDFDSDGLTNAQEQEIGSNPTLSDTDRDFVADGLDSCIFDPLNDRDGDGICGNLDNCSDYPNVSQQDSDGDGIGDQCQCGDLNGDGYFSESDSDLFDPTDTSNLTLLALQNCDVNGDSFCTATDKALMEAYLASPNTTKIRSQCASEHALHGKLLSRIGYGPDQWSRDRLQELGIEGYILEQLSPSLIDDEPFDLKRAYYADDNSAFPILDKSHIFLKSHYCDEALDYCYPRSGDGELSIGSNGQISRVLGEVKFIRSIYSRRQLDAMLGDFWFNHFNVYGASGDQIWFMPQYQEIIDDHKYGQFEDMLMAVTKSHAMLNYLNLRGSRSTGPNENYAREVMELHTIGPVDTYDEAQIYPVARVLTGYQYTSFWNLSALPEDEEEFLQVRFNSGSVLHDMLPKQVQLANTVQWKFAQDGINSTPENSVCGDVEATAGENEVFVFMCLLARHPKSAELVGKKLIKRFLGEDAPIDEVLPVFQLAWANSNANLRRALTALLTARPGTEEYGSYLLRSLFLEQPVVKRPLEYSASMVRALRVGIEGAPYSTSYNKFKSDLINSGEDSYRVGPPTGYPEEGKAWLGNSSVLIKLNQIDWVIDTIGTPLSYLMVKPTVLDGFNDDLGLINSVVNHVIPSGKISVEQEQALLEYMQFNLAHYNAKSYYHQNIKALDLLKLILALPQVAYH